MYSLFEEAINALSTINRCIMCLFNCWLINIIPVQNFVSKYKKLVANGTINFVDLYNANNNSTYGKKQESSMYIFIKDL